MNGGRHLGARRSLFIKGGKVHFQLKGTVTVRGGGKEKSLSRQLHKRCKRHDAAADNPSNSIYKKGKKEKSSTPKKKKGSNQRNYHKAAHARSTQQKSSFSLNGGRAKKFDWRFFSRRLNGMFTAAAATPRFAESNAAHGLARGRFNLQEVPSIACCRTSYLVFFQKKTEKKGKETVFQKVMQLRTHKCKTPSPPPSPHPPTQRPPPSIKKNGKSPDFLCT